ncbi:MAG TPA: hypothetical protein VG939_01020, partial [Caulobacteraceae bacterium]|nr:hypothetical protein [Caulobacteraceae bacterium]
AGPLRLIALAGAFIWICQAQAACYRLALGRPAPGLAGARVTADVTRLIAVGVLQAVLMAILAALVFVVVGAVAYGVASPGKGFVGAEPGTWRAAMGPTGEAIVATVGAAGLGFLAWARARLAFGAAATVDLGKVQVLSAWPLTRGRVLAVLLAALAAGAPTIGVLALVDLLPSPPTDPRDLLLLGLLLGLALCGLTLPLNAGLMTYLYRRDRQSPRP